MAPVTPFRPSPATAAESYRIGGHQVSYELLSTLKQASSRTGIDFAYLVAQAGQESGFKADAQARTSSARGLFQFIDSTWLETVRDHGAKHGLAEQAQKIVTGSDGKPRVSDADARRDILALRDDPRIASVMAAEYARSNQQILSREFGVEAKKVDLYLGHFLGAGGATKFLTGLKDNPAQSAAALLPEAASANKGVFYTPDGKPRSLGEIYAFFNAKLDSKSAGLDIVPLDGQATALAQNAPYGNSAVQAQLDEQRKFIDQNMKLMAMEMLHKIMLGNRSKLMGLGSPKSSLDSES
ncbi:MAG: transglycosylase SLT domain-containing protein [Ferrovibrio sp.]|uniref:transglycosylase SLT domain-containing protein n=1 Tax=Ferrovibrio sp. TaxID=1917215 RepID=UPI002637D656|nr:transglycosylase SLT domain-containing protein [Ferrovibrio sp.]MCW0232640.1 transglycosylase SLT domain-containing protein [Ferrovibrio sp.]